MLEHFLETLLTYIDLKELVLDVTLGSMTMGFALFFPLRRLDARPEIVWDLIGMACLYYFTILYYQWSTPLSAWLMQTEALAGWQFSVRTLPWWIIIPVNFVLSDLAAYWMHRGLHTRWLWPTHAWHHAPKCLYWLSGMRGSFVNTFLLILPYTLIYLIIPTPRMQWVSAGITVFSIFNQHYIHSAIRLPLQKQLEYVFVTPRFHFVHHSAMQVRNDSNYGFAFSIWDRLFGTYTNPETVEKNDPLGLSYEISHLRLILGVPARFAFMDRLKAAMKQKKADNKDLSSDHPG